MWTTTLGADFVLLPAAVSVDAAIRRAAERHRRLSDLLKRDWPIAFWAAFGAVGIAMLAISFVAAGIAILVIPTLVLAWGGVRAGFRQLTYDPWK